ncbi:hypothetical protein AKJ37_03850 [candidate division MSBL1 archaeon SCGC-AAA259I09]|uniref:Thil AANH domain-containing protein n=1 Tax=candidate division MSBL1 archaeon SCGC-AAA259I09 TaxID=1698267 RepID=A0A133USC8_9EURY|nr:hypothetical protein AKJ37_03850 [candidate division MSBL1 archaeon SCGC-AAA259I09]
MSGERTNDAGLAEGSRNGRVSGVEVKEKVIGLVSGGIDSPVAVCLAAKEFEVILLHFCLYPLSSRESSLKAIETLRDLKSKINFEKAIIFPWAGVLKEIRSEVRDGYSCVVCRRSMLLTASEIGKQEGAGGIVTGEALGQKASQTLENLAATSANIELPLLRPLIGMNKQEIIGISKEIGIWKPDHAGCCLATPQKPRTRAEPEEVAREMKKINLQKLIKESEEHSLSVKNLSEIPEDYFFEIAGKFG